MFDRAKRGAAKGITATPGSDVVPTVLLAFDERCPHPETDLRVMKSIEIPAGPAAQTILDFVLSINDLPADLLVEPIGRDELWLVTHHSLPTGAPTGSGLADRAGPPHHRPAARPLRDRPASFSAPGLPAESAVRPATGAATQSMFFSLPGWACIPVGERNLMLMRAVLAEQDPKASAKNIG